MIFANACTKKEWERGISSEISFWENTFKNKDQLWKEGYKMKLDPDSKLQEIFLKYLNRHISENKILDVGAGPLTTINKKCDFTKLDIHAIDPLANQYNRILKERNICPTVKTEELYGEELTNKYDVNSFDITYSGNALDHSYNPLSCIEEMIKVTKTGGYIILQHYLNEGTNNGWEGLHKWNFFIKNNNLFLKGKETIEYNISDYFNSVAEQINIYLEGRTITAVFKKL